MGKKEGRLDAALLSPRHAALQRRSGHGPVQQNGRLERWKESGTAPEQIVASHVTNGQVDMTRPLCPYPQTAVYKGTGSVNDAASFSCKKP